MNLPHLIRCVLLLIVAAFTAGTAVAQTAASARKPAPPPPKREALFVGADTAAWMPKTRTKLLPTAAAIETQAQKLSSRLRNSDPFGLSTFPREDSQPVFEDDTMREAPRITLNMALQTLKINGVNLQRKEFLIGGRNAFEGDVIELAFKGEVFQAQIIEVNGTQIMFRDLQRDESGTLLHSIIPQLAMEPLQKGTSRLESRMTPMESATPPQKP